MLGIAPESPASGARFVSRLYFHATRCFFITLISRIVPYPINTSPTSIFRNFMSITGITPPIIENRMTDAPKNRNVAEPVDSPKINNSRFE